jgi:hypothetical protein
VGWRVDEKDCLEDALGFDGVSKSACVSPNPDMRKLTTSTSRIPLRVDKQTCADGSTEPRLLAVWEVRM